MTTRRSPGDRVRLVRTGNVVLEGSLAVVASVEPWGCHLVAPAAATGRYRAAWSEMQTPGSELVCASPTGQVDDAPAGKVVGHIAGNEGRVEAAVDTPEDLVYLEPRHRQPPPADGIGQPCTACGGLNLRRSGSCLVCMDCGTTSGCS